MKKLLSMLLALAMVVSMAAVGVSADAYVGPDWEAIDAMDYDDASDAVYDWNLGVFNEYYQDAKTEVVDLDLRMAKMAIADAKLMESGVFVPIQSNGGGYAMSRVVPRTVTGTSWGVDEYRYQNVLVANELIKAADRTALVGLWNEAADADAWEASAKQYLADNGYTLTDTWRFYNGYEIATWDTISSSQTSDAYFVAPCWAPLLQYDAKDVQQPELAESVEVSEDGTVYTFHLREGMNWVDQQGRVVAPITANDWVTSMMHLADNNDGLGYLMSADGGCGIKNYDAFISGDVTDFAEVGVKAVDDYTLQYTLEAPFPAFLSMVGYACFCPLNYEFYKSQGGTFSAEGDEYTSGNYGTSPSTIAYCGAYLVTNFTEKNVTSYKANPEYWDAANVQTPNIDILFTDSSDVLLPYNECKAGNVASASLNTSAVVLAKEEIPEGETETYFDLYHYISATDATCFCGWINLNRATWANYNDSTVGVSTQTEEMAARTRQALNNNNFRMAVLTAFDRGAFNATQVGEELKYTSMCNAYIPGTFQKLSNELTIEINGTPTTFPAGTYFGEIEQAQLTADGSPIVVWDPNGNDGAGSGSGFDGWYHPEEAVKFLEAAVAELAEVGVEVSAENPIYLDAPMRAYSELYVNQLNAFKQSIENVLGGAVIINLVGFDSSTDIQCAYYRTNVGSEQNYDIAPSSSGWGPDYGDGQSYLDTIQPYGYMCRQIGVY